jgi:hypothetical protein
MEESAPRYSPLGLILSSPGFFALKLFRLEIPILRLLLPVIINGRGTRSFGQEF